MQFLFYSVLCVVQARCACCAAICARVRVSSPFMEAAVITAYVDGREFEMPCILIFVSGMFVGGILTKLCCRSVQVIVDSRNQLE